MAAHESTTPPLDNDPNVRKRVCKACDRCRLKKSKCDGTTPCSRCRSDNAICVFGERKKSHDKVYPKGYVEMLEQQQSQLVDGLHELYKRSIKGNCWQGPVLDESANGRPLTHHILDNLGVLQHDKQVNFGAFEDDFEKMQQRLLGEGADLILPRRTSFETDGDPESVQASFFETSPQRLTLKNPFAAFQLPTPPIQSPSTAQSTNLRATSWPSVQRQVRPQSLHFSPGYRNWDTGLNPMGFEGNDFVDSRMRFESADFALHSPVSSNYPIGNMDTVTPLTAFNNGDVRSEVDFSDFLNPCIQ